MPQNKEYIECKTLQKAINTEISEHAEYAKESLYERGYNNGLMMAYALLLKAPAADVVEVIRCKDCKHFTKGMAIGMCKRVPDKVVMPVPYNNYCGFGERRNK